jgi:S-adenosylmethionine:tRNA ribosyltransferase-isomerase
VKESVVEFANEYGEIPVPPYVHEQPERLEDYQTIYAKETGSVAAPTAGFHFTKRLMNELKTKGVQFEFVTLHVGIGTFRPMKTKTVEEHEMHSEFVSISKETAERINHAKKEKRRVIAVGTTTVRTLEGVASVYGELRNFSGDVNLFIKSGFDFKIIDGLITNFHLPRSTLLVLVSAFAGREKVLRAYEEAIARKYRFYSFGDAMYITL